RREAVEADAVLAIVAETQRLAVFEVDHALLAHVLVRERVKRTIVEDVAVLENLDERHALVLCGLVERLLQVPDIAVERARNERGAGRERHPNRVERLLGRAVRRRLRDLPELGCRRELALGQPVNPVVEEDDVEVDVPSHGMQQVVPADAEPIAIASDDEHGQLWTGRLETSRQRERPAVDAVKAVRLDVVGEAAGAPNPTNEDDVLLRDLEVGKHLLHLGEDGVIAAAGAPTYLLVGHKILAGEYG